MFGAGTWALVRAIFAAEAMHFRKGRYGFRGSRNTFKQILWSAQDIRKARYRFSGKRRTFARSDGRTDGRMDGWMYQIRSDEIRRDSSD